MTPSEYAKLDERELKVRLRELKAEIFNLHFQQATGKLENFRRVKAVRRNIARVMTFLTARGGKR